jgi:hypothetical protein
VRRALLALALLALAGCGGSSGSDLPKIGPAKTFHLAGEQPAAPVEPGHTILAFRVDQPSGQPLTRYRTGPGPHTGIHVIVVKDDLSVLVHRHPPIGRDGRVREPVDLPSPGRYRVLADVFPRLSGPLRNFQLHYNLRVAGRSRPQPLPPFQRSVNVSGYRIETHGVPKLRVARPAFIRITVTDGAGQPAEFTPWYGALAHAVFFHAGNLDYFHTHVCGASTPGCTTFAAPTPVPSRSTKPGQLRVGILLPESGTWRMFLQFKVNGKVVTAPFTLKVT